jgi:hypothetical protein
MRVNTVDTASYEEEIHEAIGAHAEEEDTQEDTEGQAQEDRAQGLRHEDLGRKARAEDHDQRLVQQLSRKREELPVSARDM